MAINVVEWDYVDDCGLVRGIKLWRKLIGNIVDDDDDDDEYAASGSWQGVVMVVVAGVGSEGGGYVCYGWGNWEGWVWMIGEGCCGDEKVIINIHASHPQEFNPTLTLTQPLTI